jgi:predicted PurR-regulated permease PerM
VDKNRIESLSLLALFAGVSLLLFYVFEPFIQLLALGAVFAVLLQHPFEWLSRRLYGWKTPAATLVVLLVLVFFIVPILLLGIEIFREAQGLYANIQGNGAQYLGGLQALVQDPIQRVMPGFTFDINTYVSNAFAFISSNLASLVYQSFFVVFETVLMLLAFFFFLRDGETTLEHIKGMSPFGEKITESILENLRQTVQSVVKGTILIALMRWVFVGVGFFIFGIPNAIFWGSIGGVVGAIPGVGTLVVFLPAIVYLFLKGSVLSAIGLSVFTVIALVLLDNVLTPYFFQKGLAAPQIFVLFSILGGILFFGPLGFIFGPLVLSVFLSVFTIYSKPIIHSGVHSGVHPDSPHKPRARASAKP